MVQEKSTTTEIQKKTNKKHNNKEKTVSKLHTKMKM